MAKELTTTAPGQAAWPLMQKHGVWFVAGGGQRHNSGALEEAGGAGEEGP